MLPNLFHLGHHPLIAKGIVASYQGGAFLWGKPLDQPAQAFITDNLVHAEYLGGDFVAAQSGNVRIAPLPIQNR